VRAGSREMLFAGRAMPDWAVRATRRAAWRSALIVFVAVEEQPIGALLLADELRADTPRAIRMLREAGVGRIVMVTGDRAAAAQSIGAALDLDAVLADRVPSDKVDAVRAEQRLNPTVMVGDGINDAPALASADVGIALGARGASASSEAADVVILADRLDRVPEAIVIAQRARRIAIESIAAGSLRCQRRSSRKSSTSSSSSTRCARSAPAAAPTPDACCQPPSPARCCMIT
jgi:P-type E1-E2 ATPase